MATPRSQKASERPVGFILYGGGPTVRETLVIRPEELTHEEPSRSVVHQTFDDAWNDDFGRGVATIRISGHTGWRGSKDADGVELFSRLRNTVYLEWHRRRAALSSNGKDPAIVQLIFVDQLDKLVVSVVPGTFSLRRHKSKPLLLSYTIPMTVLGPPRGADTKIDPIAAAITNRVARVKDTGTGLANNLAAQKEIGEEFGETALPPEVAEAGPGITGILGTALSVTNMVLSVIENAEGAIDAKFAPLLSIASTVFKTARNAMQLLARVGGLSQRIKHLIQRTASVFNDAYCLLVNGIDTFSRYFDFSDLFGASTCSSTGGGRPASEFVTSGQNPFLAVFSVDESFLTVDSGGASALSLLSSDPLNQTSSTPAQIGASLQTASEGISVAETLPESVNVVSQFEQRVSGFRAVSPRVGEPIQSLAARELGDASRWPEIVSINSLSPPYVLTGDPVNVPDTAGAVTAVVGADRSFGADVRLRNGRLALNAGDLDAVSGVSNLSQALSHRINTSLGELVFHGDYGCAIREIIGDAGDRISRAAGEEFVRVALLSDPRVVDARDMRSTIGDGALRIEGKAVSSEGAQFDVRGSYAVSA